MLPCQDSEYYKIITLFNYLLNLNQRGALFRGVATLTHHFYNLPNLLLISPPETHDAFIHAFIPPMP